MGISFSLCDACNRHVKSHEPACPFCGSARDPNSSPRDVSTLKNKALPRSRAAILFGAAASATAISISACSSSSSSTVAPYGLAPPFDSGSIDAGRDAFSAEPPYGVAVPPDSGSGTDAGAPDSSTDAGEDDAGD